MFNKIVDVLKEVFWLKPSRKKAKPSPSTRPKKSKRAPGRSAKKFIAPKPVKKPTKKTPKKPSAGSPRKLSFDMANLTQVGAITHYFDRIKVCVIKLTHGTVLIGDKLTIIGPKSRFVQKVWSMQIESVDVKVAKKGQLIGLKIDKVPAVGDKVYK